MPIAVQEKLFSPVTLGALELRSRIVMAPLTRLRADEHGVPTEIMVEHYAQRAALGLIVTEGTWPVVEGRSWIGQPGIETEAHIAGWRKVTDAVHAAGGSLVMQIMHGGRMSHPSLTGPGRVVAPSALARSGQVRTPEGKADLPVPHALELQEISEVIDQFVRGARNAMEAGFDGVQIHGANGYLLHQFTDPASNIREDHYGGSPHDRGRLTWEVTGAVAAAIGADRTSVRLSPPQAFAPATPAAAGGTDEADPLTTYAAIARQLAPLGLAFVDVLNAEPAGELVQTIRRAAGAPLVANPGFGDPTSRAQALGLVEEDVAEAVGVGRAAIANPDLARRWEEGLEENEPVPATFYVGGARGYTDYPALVN